MFHLMVSDKTFLERFRDWDLDVSDIWDWFASTAGYYFDAFGIWGWVIVGIAVIVMGLSFDLTHSMTSLVMAGVIRSIGSILTMLTAGLLFVIFKATGSSAIARARDAVRFWGTRWRQNDPGEDV